MKIKFLIASLVLGASISSYAQGYKDGIEYYKIDQLDNAKELLNRNLNDASTNKAESYYYLGMIEFHKGNLAGAKADFDKGVQADANNPYNYVGQAAIALKNNNAKDAEELLKQARKLTKKDAKLETAIARTYYDVDPTAYAKQISKSIADARKWQAQDPDSYVFEGDMYADKKQWGEAAGQYELAMNYDPNLVEAYVKYANTYFNVNPEMAIQKLQELLKKQPNSALAQRQLAEKYYTDNQGAKAAEQYGEYIKNPNHFSQDEVRYVQLLFFGGKYQESYDLATSLVNKLPAGDEQVFYMRRMQLYNLVQLKKWAEAAEAGKAFFGMTLPDGSTYESRDYTDYAQALQNSGNPTEAIANYEKAAKINPNNLDLLRNLSDTYTDAKDYDKAVEFYKKVCDNEKHTSNDLYQLAVCYYNQALSTKDPAVKKTAIEEGMKYLTAADEKVPDNLLIVNRKASYYKLMEGEKNTGKACDAYKQLLKLLDSKEDKTGYDSYYISAYNYLANYEFNAGDKALAKTYYEKWLEHDPKNEALRKYVQSLK